MLQQTYVRGRGVSVCCTGAYTQVNFYPIFKEMTIVLVTVDKNLQIQIIVLSVLTLSVFMFVRMKPGTEYCKRTAHTHNSSPPLWRLRASSV